MSNLMSSYITCEDKWNFSRIIACEISRIAQNHPYQPTSIEHYVFAQSHHFIWFNVRNPSINLVVFKVSKKLVGTPNW